MEAYQPPIPLLSWLSPDTFKNNIGTLPDSFRVDNKLNSIFTRIVDTWLTELIGLNNVTIINQVLKSLPNASPQGWPEDTQKWMQNIEPFLAHAIWSEYILTSNVTVTVNGPVTVYSDGSEPLTDQQRKEISRLHKGYADTYALKLSKMAASSQCGARVGSGRPSIKSAGGKRRSRFQ
ncbi:hypothetical protein WBJ53_15020 [Spirosoma sp. SC4-14]|uniref:DUF6712 family protein n=1 Tax=Spirosoma sp. SC4-14 TaxID=3128900 RepID=UPI0030CDE437